MENANKPVNPQVSSIENSEGNLCAVFTESGKEGLTKREYFAGLAMQGLISNPNIKRPKRPFEDESADHSNFSKIALEYADSLLKQLENTK